MNRVNRFEDLIAWQKARSLSSRVYLATLDGRFTKDFVLSKQMRASALSLPSNIAEGFERGGRAEFAQFLSIAKGSCAELRTQLYVAGDIGYIEAEQLNVLLQDAEEVTRIVAGLRTAVANQRRRLSPKS